MGNEFGQTSEWNYKSELDWYLLQYEPHKKLQECVRDLNHLLTSEPAMYINQFNQEGFEWIDLNHRQECIMVYKRKGKKEEYDLVIIMNLTPVVRWDWQIELKGNIVSKEIFNSDSKKYWGSGIIYNSDIRHEILDKEQKKYKIIVNLPPLSAIVLK